MGPFMSYQFITTDVISKIEHKFLTLIANIKELNCNAETRTSPLECHPLKFSVLHELSLTYGGYAAEMSLLMRN